MLWVNRIVSNEHCHAFQEQEEAKKIEELARQQAIAEQKRLEIEREERERKRQENELQQIRDRTLKEKMNQISKTAHGQKLLKTLHEDVSNPEELLFIAD